MDATITASVPAAPAQPPSGLTPASTPTPISPRTTPTALEPVARSLLRKRSARRATKIGIDAFPIAATPESILVSPQAMSVNGSAVLKTPRIIPARTIERIPSSLVRTSCR